MWKKTGNSVFYFLLLAVSLLAVDTVQINSSVDKKSVPINGHLTLTLSVEGSRNIPGISLPELPAFSVVGQSSSTQIQITNGRQSSTKSFKFTLRPKKVGSAQIPALNFSFKNKQYTTKPIAITVTKYVTPNARPQRRSMSILDSFFGGHRRQVQSVPPQKAILKYGPSKKYLYVGEKTLLDFKLYYEKPFRDGPVAVFPDLSGFVSGPNPYDLRELNPREERLEGKPFKVISHRNTIYASSIGSKTIDALKVQYVDNPFEGVKAVESKPIKLKIVSLPEPQPSLFSGAIGSFKMQLDVDIPQEVNVNSSIPIVIKLTGWGNADMVNQIVFGNEEDFGWYLDSMGTEGSEGLVVKKIFKYFLTPGKSGEFKLPDIQFCYFNPRKKIYKYETGEIPTINVLASTLQNAKVLNGSTKGSVSLDQGELEIRLNKGSLLFAGRTILKLLQYGAYIVIFFGLIYILLRWRTLPLKRLKKALNRLSRQKNLDDKLFIQEAYFILSDLVKLKYKLSLAGATKSRVVDTVCDESVALFVNSLVAKYEELQYANTSLRTEEKVALIKDLGKMI